MDDHEADEKALIKCVVWDLDGTLWQGTLMEQDTVDLTPGVKEIIRELDNRGILQSIASRNDFDPAWLRLAAFGLDSYFLHPQISWGSKSDSIRTIAAQLGIGLDAVAFVDDQEFERDEVRHFLPTVTTIDAADLATLLHLPALQPRFITTESRNRRQVYQADIRRQQSEDSFAGSKAEFLATLGIRLTIRRAGDEDLRRAEELTIRAHQLNATGRTYSYAALQALAHSSNHVLLVADLEDRYGSSGTIGLAMVELKADYWLVRLLITSCRVINRGIGAIMLNYILESAKDRGSRLRAEFIPTDRNRMMYLTYKFHGFVEVGEKDGTILLEHALETIRPIPPYITVCVADSTETISGA